LLRAAEIQQNANDELQATKTQFETQLKETKTQFETQLKETKAQLEETKAQLKETKAQLEETKAQLEATSPASTQPPAKRARTNEVCAYHLQVTNKLQKNAYEFVFVFRWAMWTVGSSTDVLPAAMVGQPLWTSSVKF